MRGGQVINEIGKRTGIRFQSYLFGMEEEILVGQDHPAVLILYPEIRIPDGQLIIEVLGYQIDSFFHMFVIDIDQDLVYQVLLLYPFTEIG